MGTNIRIMTEIDILKQDIIDRYNMSWVDAHLIDNTGLIQACKDQFKATLELLLEKVYNSGINIKN